MNTPITLKPKYTLTSHQTWVSFLGMAMKSVDLTDKNKTFYLLVVQFEANRHIISVKNIESNTLIFSSAQLFI